MNPNNLFGIIQARRSIRRYRPDDVPGALLRRLLEAAAWAPSAHNRQPWRFVVVQTPEARRGLADAMAARWREAGGDSDRVEPRRARLAAAPVQLVFCMTMADMDAYPDARRRAAERDMAVQSVAMAGQNLLLVAQAAGLGACWLCAPLFCPGVVREVLALPEDYEPLGLVTLGYPEEAGRSRAGEREPLETRVLWR